MGESFELQRPLTLAFHVVIENVSKRPSTVCSQLNILLAADRNNYNGALWLRGFLPPPLIFICHIIKGSVIVHLNFPDLCNEFDLIDWID